jgi:hypothetical protein
VVGVGFCGWLVVVVLDDGGTEEGVVEASEDASGWDGCGDEGVDGDIGIGGELSSLSVKSA